MFDLLLLTQNMRIRDELQGCHSQGKVRENNFFKVREKSGNSVPSQGNTKFYLKAVESQVGQPTGLRKGRHFQRN